MAELESVVGVPAVAAFVHRSCRSSGPAALLVPQDTSKGMNELRRRVSGFPTKNHPRRIRC
jgi:hypothetical protein